MFRAWYESMIPSSPTDNLELREGSNEEEEDDIHPEEDEDDIHPEQDEDNKAEKEEDEETDETASVRRDSEENSAGEEEERPRQRLSGGLAHPVT